VFEKKGIERKVRREDFWVEIFAKFVFTGLDFMFVFLRVKVTEKKKKFSKCFSERFEIEGCWKILKLKNVRVVCFPVSWAPCCKTWLKFEIKFASVGDKKMIACYGEKKMMKDFFSKYFSGGGLCLTHVWAPCCE